MADSLQQLRWSRRLRQDAKTARRRTRALLSR
jgi:hypothetical protein